MEHQYVKSDAYLIIFDDLFDIMLQNDQNVKCYNDK